MMLASQLAALPDGAIALRSVASALWRATGERNAMRLRKKVYKAVTTREMEWLDTKMGAEDLLTIKVKGLSALAVLWQSLQSTSESDILICLVSKLLTGIQIIFGPPCQFS